MEPHDRAVLTDVVPRASRGNPAGPASERRRERLAGMLAALVGAVVFVYQVPADIVLPTHIRWMMKADRGASLLAWLFERNEPWTLPFGILHTMMAPLVTIADGLLSPPAKLLFGWVQVPWQYEGALLLAFYMLQALFGFLLLRAFGARRSLSVLGAAFFALSPTLLQRFEHVSLSAHWEILAAWWLVLRSPPQGSSWRVLLPWLGLVAVAVPTHPYIAAMVGAIAIAAYARAVWIDKLFPWWTAAWHAILAALTTYGVAWLYGFFVIHNLGEAGFGRFFADVFSFFNSAGSSSVLPHIPRMAGSFDLFGPYESYYYLGLGMIVLLIIALGCAMARAAGRLSPVADDGRGSRSPRWPPLGPAIVIAAILFVYALATPIRVLGHDVAVVHLYDHIPEFTAAFRGSGRFAWPLYYLIMVLTLAGITTSLPPRRAATLLTLALAIQIIDLRPLRAFERKDYNAPYEQLTSPAWSGIGHRFRSLRLVPPIVANRIACRHYDHYSDYEIKFGVLAATEHMSFNSGSPARVETLVPLCVPLLDSLEHGLLDAHTVYIPSAPYREAIEWWTHGRAVCGIIEAANVCVDRYGPNADAPLTRLLLEQERSPMPVVLHIDLRTGDQGAVDSTIGFSFDSRFGRRMTARHASIVFGQPLSGPLQVTVDPAPADSLFRSPLIVSIGTESKRLALSSNTVKDTLRFSGDPSARSIDFTVGVPGAVPLSGPASATRDSVGLRGVTIKFP